MIELSNKTIELINKIFSKDLRNDVNELLKNECCDNIPFYEKKTERIHFSVLKLSMGKIDKLIDAIELAQTDWRDLFLAAEFANDSNAHDAWAQKTLNY